jgi:hypothetical protein
MAGPRHTRPQSRPGALRIAGSLLPRRYPSSPAIDDPTVSQSAPVESRAPRHDLQKRTSLTAIS